MIHKSPVFNLLALFAIVASSQAHQTKVIYSVNYDVKQPLVLTMGSTKELTCVARYKISDLQNRTVIKKDNVTNHYQTEFLLNLAAETLSPQFSILGAYVTETKRNQTMDLGYIISKVKLQADFIGHAILKASLSSTDNTTLLSGGKNDNLLVEVVQDEGVWGLVFKISVPLVIIISYINLGAQIDTENMKELVKKPKTIILGFALTVLVMPIISWAIGRWLLSDQLLYRVGSFVYACGPAASASTLWTVMLKADKELSVGLQVISTFGALFTMPMLLFLMDRTMQAEQHGHQSIQVPYLKLIQTLAVLMLALFVGWRFIGRHESAQKISQRIFRPLTFAVLIFIIAFSSVLYWFIYRMFDWNITLTAVLITLATYLISGLLGYCINLSIDQAIAAAIGSAYKNEGIAFAVLFVAFGQPDLYIAYVPCLTQVVVTSLFSYLAYCLLTLVNYARRRGQLDPIQATAGEQDAGRKNARSGSKSSEKSTGDNDEFVAMNVTDVP